MNLKTLIKKITAIQEKQDSINKKFSAKGKSGYIHQQDLKRDQEQDIRIFGFTNSQTIQYFRDRSSKGQRRTAFKQVENRESFDNMTQKQIQNNFKRRTKTVQEKRRKNLATASPLNLKRPQTSLYLNKISNHKTLYFCSGNYKNSALTFQKSSPSTNITGQTLKFTKTPDNFYGKNSFMVCKMISSPAKEKSPSSIHSKNSISRYKRQFSREFLSNIQTLIKHEKQDKNKNKKNTVIYDSKKQIQKPKLIRKSTKQIIKDLNNYSNETEAVKKDQRHKSNIFELTLNQTYSQQDPTYLKYPLRQDLSLLRKLCPLLLKKSANMIPLNRRLCGVHKWLPVWRADVFSHIKGKFNILIVQTKSLKTILIEDVEKTKLGLSCKNLIGPLNLENIIKSLLKQHPNNFIHFTAYQQNYLAHQQFIINGDLYVKQSKHHQSLITQYFLKRYLCKDTSIQTISQVMKNTEMILKEQHNIPEEFDKFVVQFPERWVYFYDRRSKLLQCFLNKVLYGGLSHLHCRLQINRETSKSLRRIALKNVFSESFYNSHYFYI